MTVAALLSAWLGDRKHEQLAAALERVEAESVNPRSRPIGPRSHIRRARREHVTQLRDTYRHLRAEREFRTAALETSWAAGLFDGDGSTSAKNKTRKDGTVFHTVCAGLAQSGPAGVPEVLTRFSRVVALGRVYGPYRWRNTKVPGYQWQVASYRGVFMLEALLGPLLCGAKREQANAALRTFAGSGHRRKASLIITPP